MRNTQKKIKYTKIRAICDLSEPETARPIVRDELFMNVLPRFLRCYYSVLRLDSDDGVTVQVPPKY